MSADARSASDLTRQILAVATRVSGDPCRLVVATLHGLLRVTVESTDESGGEYARSAVGVAYEGALRSLLGVMAQDAANDDGSTPDTDPPALQLVPDAVGGDDGSWPAHAVDALSQETGFAADDVDGLFAAEMAREADVAGEWRVSA